MQKAKLTPAMIEVQKLQQKAGFDPSTGKFKSFETLVSEHQATHKCGKTEAIRFVRKKHPVIYARYIEEINA